VTVELTLYDSQGQVFVDTNNGATYVGTGDLRGFDVSNYSERVTGKTASFQIKPHGSSLISLEPGSYKYGYGQIEWNIDDSSRRKALLAHGRVHRNKSNFEQAYSIVINNGQAF